MFNLLLFVVVRFKFVFINIGLFFKVIKIFLDKIFVIEFVLIKNLCIIFLIE